ncbi:MAG TPA: hypothetical protein ENN43_02865 [bacterium]|nr:hypothetical protein [bacterium]
MYGGGDTYEVVRKTDIFGINITPLASYRSGPLEAAVGFSILAGITGKESGKQTITGTGGSQVSTELESFDRIKDGGGFSAMAKARYDLGIAEPAFGFGMGSTGHKEYSGPGDTSPVDRIIDGMEIGGGVSLKPADTVKIPVEIRITTQKGTWKAGTAEAYERSFGVEGGAGCEFKVTKEAAIRAGAAYSLMENFSKWGDDSEEKEPTNTGLLFSAGAGFILGKTKIDISVLYKISGVDPLPAGTKEFSAGTFQAAAGIFMEL